MTELCKTHGISRKTGYKWVERFYDGGLPALIDHSRAPHTRPHVVSGEVVDVLVELRKRRKTWGPKAHLAKLHPGVQWPAESTVGLILRRHGLVEGHRRRTRTPPSTRPLAAATEPKIVWCTDLIRCAPSRFGRRFRGRSPPARGSGSDRVPDGRPREAATERSANRQHRPDARQVGGASAGGGRRPAGFGRRVIGLGGPSRGHSPGRTRCSC